MKGMILYSETMHCYSEEVRPLQMMREAGSRASALWLLGQNGK